MSRYLPTASTVIAFFAAVVLATVLGSIIQTQYNLDALRSIGAEITDGVRLQTTVGDIASGFTPTYGGYIVLPALLVGFAVAWWIIGKGRQSLRLALFALAGGLAILAAIPLVNWLSPVALLVGASRDFSCTVLMALGGSVAGVLFASLTSPRLDKLDRDGHRYGPEPATS